jgi:8-hydroxy-5-deazaflavin:NADPH oxidoreductase
MNVGILGSGVVAQQLGLGFGQLGHAVKLGTRDASKLKEWQSGAGPKASVGSFQEAAAFGELVVLATLGTAAENAIRLAGPENFAGKVVIDTTNPLDFSHGMPPRLAASAGDSLGERVQKWLPKARVVKAFNTINAHIMCKARREQGVPDLFIAGNDESAKKTVSQFAGKWGWGQVIDLGGIEQAYLLEAFAMLWIAYGAKHNNWTHAFKLLVK